MIAFVIQTIIAIVVSAGTLLLIAPMIYLIIGALSALVICGFVLHSLQDDEPGWYMLVLFPMAVGIGLFWPIATLASAYAVYAEHADEDRQDLSRER